MNIHSPLQQQNKILSLLNQMTSHFQAYIIKKNKLEVVTRIATRPPFSKTLRICTLALPWRHDGPRPRISRAHEFITPSWSWQWPQKADQKERSLWERDWRKHWKIHARAWHVISVHDVKNDSIRVKSPGKMLSECRSLSMKIWALFSQFGITQLKYFCSRTNDRCLWSADRRRRYCL